MVLQADSAMREQIAMPVVDIVDERDLARDTLVQRQSAGQARTGWRERMRMLGAFLSDDLHHQTSPELEHDVADAETYIRVTVMPAFEEARAALEAEGREVRLSNCGPLALMRVLRQGRTELTVAVRTRLTPTGVAPAFETSGRDGGRSRRHIARARLDATEQVAPAHAQEVRQRQVAGFVLAAHKAARRD